MAKIELYPSSGPVRFNGEEIVRDREGFQLVAYQTDRGNLVVWSGIDAKVATYTSLEEFKTSEHFGGHVHRFGDEVAAKWGGEAEELDI